MISNARFRRDLRIRFGWLILVAAAVVAGCSTSASNGSGGSVNHITAQGTSVSGWLASSGASIHSRSATTSFIALGNAGGCTECHGADLLGGISRVSCMSNPSACHHGTVTGWVAAGSTTQQHGASVKRGPGGSSMYACRICHGTDFRTDRGGVTCFSCHTLAPHPNRPWRSGGVDNTHVNVNTANAPVCYGCHADSAGGNANNPHRPPSPAAAGTAPGCFNGTMCHNQAAAPHATGSTWLNAGTGFHGTDAKADLTYCQGCHGSPGTINFNGGSASTACSTCHTTADAHPTDWQGVRAISTASITHRTSGNRTAACGICHKVDAPGAGLDPSAPSCFSASYTNGAPGAVSRGCHANGPSAPNHPVPFLDNTAHTQATSATFTADCGSCHAVTGTSPVSGAPLCTTCHVSDPRGVTNCTSCHANPPGGATTAYPNAAGSHSAHIALNGAGAPVTCSTCHTGLGSGTLSHYDRTRPPRVSPGSVAFVTTYNAKTGASGFDNSALLRCTNVSCHGGQATPNWQTGTITVNSQAGCTSCHASGTAQFNSYNSGRHGINSAHSTCLNCHNTATLATNHFTSLATTAMEGPASATIGGAGTSVTTYVAATRSCSPSCHGTETW